MTVGIAASGPGSVTSVLRSLIALETLASGAIGGFAVLAVMDATGAVHYAQTQAGGSKTLQLDSSLHNAQRAALISSGPHRPEPLIQFLPAASGVGMVTGHRLPNRCGQNAPVNVAALNKMQAGEKVASAVQSVLAAVPEVDAGLLAINAQGDIAYANSQRVQRRQDLFDLYREAGSLQFALMMNSIHFPAYLQQHVTSIVGDVAMGDAVSYEKGIAHMWQLEPGCPLQLGGVDEVIVDPSTQCILSVTSADHNISAANGRWIAIPHATQVRTLSGVSYGWVLHDVVARIHQQRIQPLDDTMSAIPLFTGLLS